MITIVVAYFLTLILFIGIDLVWLMGLGRPIYVAEIGGLLRSQPNMMAAVAFYLLYAAGLCYFAVLPALKSGMPLQALGLGAFLGLMAYGTYDLTNLAVAHGFTTRIALIDMAWGTLLSGVVAWASSRILSVFGLS